MEFAEHEGIEARENVWVNVLPVFKKKTLLGFETFYGFSGLESHDPGRAFSLTTCIIKPIGEKDAGSF